MRRRWLKPSGVLGALALSLGLSTPAWAMWDGIDPIKPIMPRWTWEGIEMQERLRDLTPEQQTRIRRLPADQQEDAIEDMIREQRGAHRGESGMHERVRRSGETKTERRGSEGEMRRQGETERQTEDEMRRDQETPSPDSDMRQQEKPSESDMRQQEKPSDSEMRQREEKQIRQEQRDMQREHHETSSGVRAPASSRQTADSNTKRTEVELKPVPKSQRAPGPGETEVTADNPVDEAADHLEMARTSAMSEDWDAAKTHLRQAGDALEQINARNDRNAQRYIDRLKSDIRNAEQAVDTRARDLDTRLQNIERNVRHLKPEER